MKNIIIRSEKENEYYQTELMTMRAFWNIHDPGCNEHYLVHILRKSNAYLKELSRVAEVDGKIVGAIFYLKAWINDGIKNHEIVTFGPLAIDPMYQNQGIGKLLLEETFKLVKKAKYPGICILGEPDYYPKHGFKNAKEFKITDENGNNYDALMVRETEPGSLNKIHGKFIESEVFKNIDEEKVLLFNKNFPSYPMYKVKSQWLHKEKLGKVIVIENDQYLVEYWEGYCPSILSDKFQGYKPKVGDLVTFVKCNNQYQILMIEENLLNK